MANVYRSRKYEPIVKRLTEPSETLGKPIFPTIMDLLIFCAMLGYENNRRERVESDNLEVPGRVFENQKAEMYIYLAALIDTKDMNILREENDNQMYSVFEDYANGGLAVLSDWFDENPSDIIGDQILLRKITEKLAPTQSTQGTDYTDVNF